MLVPAVGKAATLQGEKIRVAGRIFTEIEQDGAANWDNDFRMMLAALDNYTSAGAPLTAVESDELRGLIRTLRGGRGPEESTRALVRLAVTWVLRNPQPLPARAAHYCR